MQMGAHAPCIAMHSYESRRTQPNMHNEMGREAHVCMEVMVFRLTHRLGHDHANYHHAVIHIHACTNNAMRSHACTKPLDMQRACMHPPAWIAFDRHQGDTHIPAMHWQAMQLRACPPTGCVAMNSHGHAVAWYGMTSWRCWLRGTGSE